MRIVYLRGRVSIGSFCQGECCYIFEGCRKDSMYLFFSFLLDTLLLYMRSCDHLQTYIVLIYFFILMYVSLSPTLHVLFLFFLYTHVSYICMQSIISVSHKDALMSFYLKCFRYIGCQSLLAIKFLLAKFFKSLCQDRFYYI